jgi:hypothetical protein
MMRSVSRILPWALAQVMCLCLATPTYAQDEEVPAPESTEESEPPEGGEEESWGRVIVERTAFRSGPGPSFRQIGVARRGEAYRIVRRGTRGYWWEVERPDGTHAFVLGDTMLVYALGDSPGEPPRQLRIFAPAPIPDATGEMAILLSWLDGSGLIALRPSFLIAPEFAFEVDLDAAVSRAGRLFMAGIGGIVNLAPTLPVVPYLVGGGGIAYSAPNADSFLLDRGVIGMLYGGGGFRFCFKQRITLRVEARMRSFFEPDRYVVKPEVGGGITVFF